MTKFNNFFRNLLTKVLMFGIGMMFTLNLVNGQTVDLTNAGSSYVQNFDGANNLADINWTFADVNNDGNTGSNAANGQGRWLVRSTVFTGTTQSSNVARGGTGQCAVYNYDSNNAANDWMFSNGFNLAAGTQYKFVYYRLAPSFTGAPAPESFRVMVTSNNTAAGALGGVPAPAQLKEYTTAATTYTEDIITFTPTTTGVFYFATFAFSAADLYYIAIDDFSVQNMNIPLNDVAVTSVTTTASAANCASFTATTPFTIKVRNTGVNAQTNIPVNFSATRNGTPLPAITSQTVPSLAPNAEVDLTINIDASVGGNYIITSTSALANDGNNSNNTRTFTIINPLMSNLLVGTSVTQNFNTLPVTNAGWTFSPVGTLGVAAAAPNPAVPAVPGWLSVTGVANSVPGAMLGLRSPTAVSNNWLFSNCMSLQSGVTYRFSYFRRAFSSPAGATTEKLRVYIGTTANTSMSTQLIPNGGAAGDELITNTAYTEVFYDFTPTASGVYYVGFNHISDASSATNAGLLVDDFTVLNVPPIDIEVNSVSATVSSTNCGSFLAATVFATKVRNIGVSNVSNVVVSFTATRNGTSLGVIPNQTITSLNSGAEVTLNVNVNTTLGGDYVFTATTNVVGDGILGNNQKNFSVFNAVQDLTAANSTYTEGFENSAGLLSNRGWTSIDVNADADLWSSAFTGAARTGAGFALSSRNDVNNSNDWLISNCVTLKAGTLYRISYYRRAVNTSTTTGLSEKMRTFWGTSNTVAAMSNQIGTEETFSNAAYTLVSFDFTPATAGTYYFGFQHTSDFNAAAATSIIGVAIDDFTVLSVPSDDIETVSITTTANPINCGSFTANTTFTVSAKNVGTSPTSNKNFTFTLTRDGNPVTTSGNPFIGPLAVNATGTFNVTADLTIPGTYVATAKAPGDGNSTNDTQIFTIVRPVQDLSANMSSYATSFESTSLNAIGWTTPTTGGWFFGNNGVLASQGVNYPFVQSSTTVVSNNWLYSPCLTMVAGKIYTLDFKYRTNTGAEKLKVFLVTSNTATTGTLIKDYPTLLSNGVYTSENGVRFVAPANGNYHIAYQLYTDVVATAGAVRIDELKVTNTGVAPGPPAEPTAAIATPGILQVDLSWTASITTGVEAATSYRVEFATALAGTYTAFTPSVAAPAVTYSHVNAVAGQQYFYRIYAVNAFGSSALFATATATANPLAAPASLTIAPQTTGNSLTLNWTASPTATGYSIERIEVDGTGNPVGSYALAGTSTTNSYTDAGITIVVTGKRYRYKVRATKGTPTQFSAYSNEATTLNPVLELDRNNFSKQIILSPNPNDGHFKVDMSNAKPNRVTFIMTDLTGKEVHRSFGNNEDSFNFEMSNLTKGAYLLYINTEKGQGVKRVIVK
ncbi:MAG: T9SS C-terminal target domain-containing protein [Bacteroidetes bacterium]|nr:MAG: T9SS C-terminal target domain-containing protein [Bacteroidota bacterium]